MEEIRQILIYIKKFRLRSIFVNYFKVSFLVIMAFALAICVCFTATDPKKQEVIEENVVVGEK